MGNFFRLLLKWPSWLVLVLLGLITVGVASLGNGTDIAGVHNFQLVDSDRHILREIGEVLILVGLIAGLIVGSIGILTKRREANLQRLPIESIKINEAPYTQGPPDPQIRVSGEVTPKKAGVNVWLLREDRAQHTGEFSVSARHAITNDDGHWGQSVNLWTPGRPRFRIHAVVTTEENESFYRWCVRAREAAVKVRQEQHPNSWNMPGWPNLDRLPKVRVTDHRDIPPIVDI